MLTLTVSQSKVKPTNVELHFDMRTYWLGFVKSNVSLTQCLLGCLLPNDQDKWFKKINE